MKKILLFIIFMLMTFLSGCVLEDEVKIGYYEEYNQNNLYNCGLVAVSYKNESNLDTFVYLNEKGEECFGKTFELATEFYNGISIVKNEGKYYFFNYKGEFVSKGYDFMFFITEDVCLVKSGENFYLLKCDGELLYNNPIYSSPLSLRDDKIIFKDKTLNKMVVMNCDGEIIIEPKYYSIEYVGGSYYIVKVDENSKNQLIDLKNNNKILFEDFYTAIFVSEDVIGIKTSYFSPIKYYDKNNVEYIINNRFVQNAYKLNGTCYFVGYNNDDKLNYLYKKDGSLLINHGFKEIVPFYFGGKDYIKVLKDGKYYLYNDSGNLVLNEGYDLIHPMNDYKFETTNGYEQTLYVNSFDNFISYKKNTIQEVSGLSWYNLYGRHPYKFYVKYDCSLTESGDIGQIYKIFIYDENLKLLTTFDWDERYAFMMMRIIYDDVADIYYVTMGGSGAPFYSKKISNNTVSDVSYAIHYAVDGNCVISDYDESGENFTIYIKNDDKKIEFPSLSDLYYDGMYIYMEKGKFGIVSANGTIITEAKYDKINHFGFFGRFWL